FQIERMFNFLAENNVLYHEISRYEEDLLAVCGYTEIQWRIVEDYLLGLETIEYDREMKNFKSLIDARLQVKHAKIKQMLKWVHAPDCKRSVILQPFDEILREKPEHCCSNCGIDLNSFKKEVNHFDRPAEKTDWKQELAELLLPNLLS
ncbi:MAG TPA: hypothetical protein DCR24_12215, partial [Bacillus bacterium]|nr:hypothetical protein [Bacillus sp. (in: firmicutes)]